MSNDFTYTVQAQGGVIVATSDLELARREAQKAAKAMTAKGGATGHVLIDYWTKGVVTDTEHVYDDGRSEAGTVAICTNGDGTPIRSGHNTLVARTYPSGAVRREWVATRLLPELVTA